MPSKACKKCGSMINEDARTCQHCGAAQPSIFRGWFIFLGLILAFFAVQSMLGHYPSQREPDRPKPPPTRAEMVQAQFSPYDGAHQGLEHWIKANMNDPDSYEHVKTEHWDKGDHLVVKTTFRGRNGFGALVIERVEAKVGLEGEVIAAEKIEVATN